MLCLSFGLATNEVRLTGVLCTVGDGELIWFQTRQEEVVMTSRPEGQEEHCFLVIIEEKFIRHECY